MSPPDQPAESGPPAGLGRRGDPCFCGAGIMSLHAGMRWARACGRCSVQYGEDAALPLFEADVTIQTRMISRSPVGQPSAWKPFGLPSIWS